MVSTEYLQFHRTVGGSLDALGRKQTLVDGVAEVLRRMILEGEVLPGELLPPRKTVAKRLGVGVSTVHEAVQALSAVGLLDSRPGKGTWVRPDALDTLVHPAAVQTRLGRLRARQIYEARAAIEVALTELAARRATPQDLNRITKALDGMEAAIGDDRAFIDADLQFHLAVARAAHTELLEQFYHLSRKLLAEVIGQIIQLPRVKEEGLVMQRGIAYAIASHDPAKARQAAADHMVVIEALIEQIEQMPERSPAQEEK